MVTRSLRADDRDELVRMRTALWPDSTATEVDHLLTRLPEAYAVLVAERPDGGLGAFAEVGTRPYAEGCDSSPVAYLEGIWVDPGFRRSGLGAALVRHAERWALARGLTELASDADIHNQASLEFHVAAGFEEVERIVCFRRTLSGDATSP